MKKIIRLTESDLVRIVKQVISETETPKDLGFTTWGDGFILRLPQNSQVNKNAIRIEADPIGGEYNIMVLVQGNKRTRSEIKGINTFQEIETLLNSKFKRQDNVYDRIGGLGDMKKLKSVVNKLKSLKIDEKNNWFTV